MLFVPQIYLVLGPGDPDSLCGWETPGQVLPCLLKINCPNTPCCNLCGPAKWWVALATLPRSLQHARGLGEPLCARRPHANRLVDSLRILYVQNYQHSCGYTACATRAHNMHGANLLAPSSDLYLSRSSPFYLLCVLFCLLLWFCLC